MTDETADAGTVADEVRRLAEIASGILDGEQVARIITERAMHYIANPDPEHRFLSGDYFDVDHELFLRTKKLLLRVARLGAVEVSSSVWVPVPGTDMATVAVHNGVHHRYYTFGQEALAMPTEMRQVFQTGASCQLPPGDERPLLVTALGPVRGSLGDVVAVVEITAPQQQGAAPAWS